MSAHLHAAAALVYQGDGRRITVPAAPWASYEACHARTEAAQQQRAADAAAANASAEAECDRRVIQCRDLIVAIKEIDERECVVVLHALANRLTRETNLLPGLGDLVQEMRQWCIGLDEDFRERMA